MTAVYPDERSAVETAAGLAARVKEQIEPFVPK